MPAGNQVTNTLMTSNHLSYLPIKMGCYFMAGKCFGPNRKHSWNGSNLQCKHPNFKMIATFIDCRCIKHLKTDQNRDNKQDYTTRHDANIDPALALDSVPESAQSLASVALSKSEETPKPVIHCNTIFWEAINPSYCEQKGTRGLTAILYLGENYDHWIAFPPRRWISRTRHSTGDVLPDGGCSGKGHGSIC